MLDLDPEALDATVDAERGLGMRHTTLLNEMRGFEIL
jgi:hypothetical protein